MARTRRSTEQKITDDIMKIDESLAALDEKKKKVLAPILEKEKTLKSKKTELEKELANIKRDAVAELISNSNLSLDEIVKALEDKEKEILEENPETVEEDSSEEDNVEE